MSVEDDDVLVISKDSSSNVERTIFNFPLNLSQRTNIIKAEMTLTATDSTVFNDTLYVVPLEVLDLRQVQAQENYPETTNESLFTSFIPGAVTAGDEIVVDISSIMNKSCPFLLCKAWIRLSWAIHLVFQMWYTIP